MLFLHFYFWVAPQLVLGVCLLLLLRRGLHKRYAVLTCFIVLSIVQFLLSVLLNPALFHSFSSVSIYEWMAAISTGLIAILEIGVLYEVGNELLRSRPSVAGIAGTARRWTVAIFLLTGVVTCALISVTGMKRALAAFQVLDFSSNLVKVGLLLLLLLVTRVLHVPWRSLAAGIALGFAVSGCTEIAAAALLSKFDLSHYAQIDTVRMVGFHICVVIWLVYILVPEKRPQLSVHRLQRADLESWDQEIQRMAKP